MRRALPSSAASSPHSSSATTGSVRSVILDEGRLTVDFKDIRSKIPNASTSCGSAALLAQLNRTAFQFPEVAQVRYEFLGSCDTFMNFLQRECTEPTRPT